MKNNCGIYTLEINNKFYVGSSNNLKHRFIVHRSHLIRNIHCNKYLQRSYNKYKNFKFEILEICNEEFLLTQEQYWINMLGTLNKNFGYNLSPIAGTTRGIKYSQEIRNKMSNSKKGKRFTENHKKNIGLSNKGRIVTQITREKISNTLSGRKLSEERILKACKEVHQYSDNNFIKKYKSVKQASIELNIDKSDIANCANGRLKRAGGFTFKYNYNEC